MTGIQLTFSGGEVERIDPVNEIWLNSGVLCIDNGFVVYDFSYSTISKIEFYETEDK